MSGTVIAGGRVLLPGSDLHAPPFADILIHGDRVRQRSEALRALVQIDPKILAP